MKPRALRTSQSTIPFLLFGSQDARPDCRLTKREQVVSNIRYIRQELREMQLSIKEDDLFPETGELRGIMAQLEALLELVEGNTRIQSNSEAA